MGVGCRLPSWIGEAEQPKGGTPARRRRCKQGVKVSTWKGRRKQGKCGFWKGAGGGEVDISAEAKNLESLQRKNGRAKCHQTRSVIQSGLWTVAVTPSRISCICTILRRCSKIFCVASHMVGYNK